MSKVILPKKVADAIESIRKRNGERGLFNHPSIALHAANSPEYKILNQFITDNEENLKIYYQALVNGYELEATPEEILKDRYQYYVSKELHVSINAYQEVLEILGIQIKGINKGE